MAAGLPKFEDALSKLRFLTRSTIDPASQFGSPMPCLEVSIPVTSITQRCFLVVLNLLEKPVVTPSPA